MANSNVAFEVEGTTHLPGGEKLLRGWAAIGYPDTYDSTNTWFDLSNHLKSTGKATVILMSQTGYPVKYEGNRVDGAIVRAYLVNHTNVNLTANNELIAVDNNVNIATNCLFIAVGPAY